MFGGVTAELGDGAGAGLGGRAGRPGQPAAIFAPSVLDAFLLTNVAALSGPTRPVDDGLAVGELAGPAGTALGVGVGAGIAGAGSGGGIAGVGAGAGPQFERMTPSWTAESCSSCGVTAESIDFSSCSLEVVPVVGVATTSLCTISVWEKTSALASIASFSFFPRNRGDRRSGDNRPTGAIDRVAGRKNAAVTQNFAFFHGKRELLPQSIDMIFSKIILRSIKHDNMVMSSSRSPPCTKNNAPPAYFLIFVRQKLVGGLHDRCNEDPPKFT